ncbi:hypothetical protein [Mycolicibacterium sp. HS_4_1]
MKQHRIKDFDARAWVVGGPNPVVFMQLGIMRFTASVDEAEAFGRQLLQVAKKVRDAS